jgi:tetratricopeptide (TPR) repeat protein
VGCGGFADDGAFLTRQLVLLRQADERQLLQMLGAELARAGALVTFNGKSFDAPLIETRYLFHRLEWQGSQLAHLDVLHPARRFWNDGAIGDGSCSLLALEQEILGARRGGDVAGFEVPARYFRFIRTGNPQPLVAVLEHNRLDLLSLAGLTARLLQLVRAGSGCATRAREALALGRVYWQSGLYDRACKALEDALAMAREAERSHARGAPASVAIDAVRALALLCRRRRRYDEAAAYWRELLANPMCPAQLAREASEALAIHHEHRARDLAVAKAFALRSLSSEDEGRRTAWNQAVRHRVARIEKKMGLW